MKLNEIVCHLNLEILTGSRDFLDIEVTTGYCSDMLSCVMTGAENGCLWVTLIANLNIVAVASLLEIPAIIITENARPEAATIARANQQNVALLSTPKDSFEIVGRLWEMGLRKNRTG